jgi:hypothetical protein
MERTGASKLGRPPIKAPSAAEYAHHYCSEKDDRHPAFAAFIVETLLNSQPPTNPASRVVDVAGGKGNLSLALSALNMRTALVDPCAVTGRGGDFAFTPPTTKDGLCAAASNDDADDGDVLVISSTRTSKKEQPSEREGVAAC